MNGVVARRGLQERASDAPTAAIERNASKNRPEAMSPTPFTYMNGIAPAEKRDNHCAAGELLDFAAQLARPMSVASGISMSRPLST